MEVVERLARVQSRDYGFPINKTISTMQIIDEIIEELNHSYEYWRKRDGGSIEMLVEIHYTYDRLMSPWEAKYGLVIPEDIRHSNFEEVELLEKIYFKQHGKPPELAKGLLKNDNAKTRPSLNCMIPTKGGKPCTRGAYLFSRISDTQVSITCWQHIRMLPQIYGERNEGPWYNTITV